MARTVFITGASTGIGEATARAAAAAGWNVALFARSAEKLDALADEIGAAFANAGRGVDKPGTEEGDPEEWRQVVDLNIMGLLYTTRAALPELKKTKGTLVLTGSAAGRRHIKGSIYGATKWFVHGYGGNMAEEMATWGGRCAVIAPGMVDTPFFDEAKPDKLKPEDVAAAVVHAIEAPERATIREIYLMPTH